MSGGTGTAELRGCGVIDLHYHSKYSGCLFCFELEMGWDGNEWATRRSLDGSLGGDEVWVLVTMAVHRGLI